MKKLLNIEYACIHANYWMIYGIVSSFASVFLLGRGYSNTEIGIILALANVVAVVPAASGCRPGGPVEKTVPYRNYADYDGDDAADDGKFVCTAEKVPLLFLLCLYF